MATRIKTGGSRSGLFLIELIVAIGLFALASAVCVQLFFQARRTSDQSRALAQATLCAQSAAECFKATDGDLEQTAGLLDGAQLEQQGILIARYDADWRPLAPNEESAERPALFQLVLRESDSPGLLVADIEVLRIDDKERVNPISPLIYHLQVKAARL